MYLDIYEVQINRNVLTKDEQELVATILYECQCALFLVDITSHESFEGVKNVIKEIDNEKNPYLTKFFVCNKSDLEEKRAVSEFELKEYSEGHPTLHSMKLTLKGEESQFQKLLNKIYEAVNKPSNIVSQCISREKSVTAGLVSLKSFRVVFLGDSSVGKTALLNRYFKYTFEEKFLHTIGIDDETIYIKVKEALYKLTVWDTAGEERFRAPPKKYYNKANGFILLFDVTNQDTFANIKTWMKDIKDNTDNGQRKTEIDSPMTIYLVGNKVDMVEKRVVSKEKAETEAGEYGIKYFEISCKLNLNITEVMNNMILACSKRVKKESNVFEQKEKKEKQKWWRIKK